MNTQVFQILLQTGYAIPVLGENTTSKVYKMELQEKGSILGFHVENVKGQLQITTEVFVVINVTNGTTNNVQA